MSDQEFEKIIKQYQKLVFTVCYQLVKDYHESENLTQETFLSAYKHIERCDPQSYKPWLVRIATNKAKDHLKSAYVRRVQFEREDDVEQGLLETGKPLYVSSLDAGTELRAEENEAVQLIKSKVFELKEPYQKVSRMFFIEEKDVDEISKTLGRPKKTVQTQIYRARQMLQKSLKGE